ncbi:MAG: nucleoside phosphorylase [Candidatus Nanoarchaeia archaeon]|nr:nucleoside phosphorylase [Candidatus Nanoarchaeia archaeon]
MSFPQFENKHLEEALGTPEDYVKYRKFPKNLPRRYILVYSTKALNYFKRKYKPKKVFLYSLLTIYVYKEVGFVKMCGIGSPNAATVMEELIALGGKTFLNLGWAGGLNKEGVFLCTGALRDEGTSHHYLPHGKFVYPDRVLTKKFGEHIRDLDLCYTEGLTWTIDAPYRETKAEVEKYSKEGIITVEMEASALFAVAKYRKVKIASAFSVSDVLGKKWEIKFHKRNIRRDLNLLIDAGVNCLTKK